MERRVDYFRGIGPLTETNTQLKTHESIAGTLTPLLLITFFAFIFKQLSAYSYCNAGDELCSKPVISETTDKPKPTNKQGRVLDNKDMKQFDVTCRELTDAERVAPKSDPKVVIGILWTITIILFIGSVYKRLGHIFSFFNIL